MIERIYIDNYRTLVNCEIKLGSVSLLLGPNGAGKSTVFDAVNAINRFVGGVDLVSDLFPSSDLTRWQTLDDQHFDLDLRAPQGLYTYSLKIRHVPSKRRCRIAQEVLTLDGNPLFTFKEGYMQTYDDLSESGPTVSFDWHRSGLAAVHAQHNNTKLTVFKEWLSKVQFLRPCPPIMEMDSQKEAEELEPNGRNFASWYRYISRQDISRQFELLTELRHVLDGFESLSLEGPADSTLTLKALFKFGSSNKPTPFKFSELSDGERQLIVLYTLLLGLFDEKRVLLLDEFDNYLSLSEIEPWLTRLVDAPGRSIAQAIVISHHPEIVDHLAREKGIWLTRDAGGPTRVEVGRAIDTAPLKPSEVEARGW